MMLVPAGPPVDSVIGDLLPHLEKGDLIIDAGNSYFKDTDLRARNLAEQGIQFLGVGVSGGEEGARHGPSIMPGGPKEAYERVRPMLRSHRRQSQRRAVRSLARPGFGRPFRQDGPQRHRVRDHATHRRDLRPDETRPRLERRRTARRLRAWNKGELNGYLMEITATFSAKQDEKTGKRLIDEILDVAKQNGTGMWTSQSAMELQVPDPDHRPGGRDAGFVRV